MTTLARRPATLGQAYDLGKRLRQADLLEIKASCGMEGTDALVHAVLNAKRADAWLVDEHLVAMSGVSGSLADHGIGVVWMLASAEADRFPKYLLRGQRQYVQELLQGHDMLFNFVDNRNIKAQRWLRWLGFHLGEPTPFGVAQLPFRPFWLHAHGEPECPSPGHDEVNRVEVKHV
jgi:hypothetical protein